MKAGPWALCSPQEIIQKNLWVTLDNLKGVRVSRSEGNAFFQHSPLKETSKLIHCNG